MNIDEADRAVSSIKRFARQTFTPGVLAEIGSCELADAPAISQVALRAARLDPAGVLEIVLQTQKLAAELLPLLLAA